MDSVGRFCTVITFQLLLPNQLDNQFNFVNFTAGLLGIVAALLLAPKFEGIGIAWSAVAAQLYTLIAFSVVLKRAGLNPFAHKTRTAAATTRTAILVPVFTPAGVRPTDDRTRMAYGKRKRIS